MFRKEYICIKHMRQREREGQRQTDRDRADSPPKKNCNRKSEERKITEARMQLPERWATLHLHIRLFKSEEMVAQTTFPLAFGEQTGFWLRTANKNK